MTFFEELPWYFIGFVFWLSLLGPHFTHDFAKQTIITCPQTEQLKTEGN